MSTKRAVPDYGLPIVTADGKQTQEFNDAIDDMVHAIPLIGDGTPEGLVEARQGQFYIDQSNFPTLYIKQVSSVAADKSLGWVSSVQGEYSSAYWVDDITATALTEVGTFVPINGPLIETVGSKNFTISNDGILWSGADSSLFLLNLNLSAFKQGPGDDEDYDFSYGINGIVEPPHQTIVLSTSVSTPQSVTISQIITIDEGDLVVPMVAGVGTTDSAVISHLCLSLTPIGP